MRWPELFESAFRSLAPKLERVLAFASCRESWLQAEICLYLHKHGSDISTNSYSLGRGNKIDFHAKTPTPMVAELKLLGSGYAYKCFDGLGQLDRFQPTARRRRVRITPADLKHATDYFLRDVYRLSRVEAAVERYMILVIDQRNPMDALGRALLAAKLPGEEWTWKPKIGSYLVRVWRLSK